MNKWKILALCTFSAFVVSLLYNIYPKSDVVVSTEWKTYTRDKKNKLSVHNSTSDELKSVHKERKKRKLSSISPSKKNQNKDEVIYLGKIDEKEKKNLPMLNKTSISWSEDFVSSQLRYQKADTKLFLKPQKRIIQVRNGKGLFIEQVLVTIKKPSGHQTTFKAFVNSETGSLIKTWNKTIHENIGKKPMYIDMKTLKTTL